MDIGELTRKPDEILGGEICNGQDTIQEWQCFQKLSATEMRKNLYRMGYLVYQGLA